MNTTTNLTFCDLGLTGVSRVVYGTILISAAALGTVGNSILGFYVMRNTEMRSLINILLATMAVSDTLISLVCTPFDLLTMIDREKWQPLGQSTCLAHSFILSVLVVENVTILVLISVDRYCLLVQKKDRFRGCHVATLILACTAFAVAVSLPSFFYTQDRPIFANGHCRQMWKHGMDENSRSTFHIYPLLYSGLLFVLPCGLLLLAYVHIIVIVRKRSMMVHPESNNHRMAVNSVGNIMRVHMKFKQKTFSTILCLYSAAVVCKLPLAIFIFIHSLTNYKVCPATPWIMLLTYLNSAVNPFIYALKISEYWLMLTGKMNDVKNQVKSFRNRSWKRNQPQNIYMVTTDPMP